MANPTTLLMRGCLFAAITLVAASTGRPAPDLASTSPQQPTSADAAITTTAPVALTTTDTTDAPLQPTTKAVPAAPTTTDAPVARACAAALERSKKTVTTPGGHFPDYYTMIDATGKLPSGFLQGNTIFPGAFDECYRMDNTVFGRAQLNLVALAPALYKRGLNVLAGIALASAAKPPQVFLCVPSDCTADLDALINDSGYFAQLLPGGVDPPRGNGTAHAGLIQSFTPVPESVDISSWGAVCITIMVLLAALSVAGAVVTSGGVPGCCRLRFPGDREGEKKKGRQRGGRCPADPYARLIAVLRCFSLTENLATLCALEQRFPKTAALEGMRVLSMQWVVIGHTLMILLQNVDNMNYLIQDVVKQFSVMPLVNATVSVDTFFTISGFLLAYVSLRKLRKLAAKNPHPRQYVGAVIMFIVHRWLRIVPVLGIVMLASAELVPSVGSGPGWQGRAIGKTCREYWWTNVLFINNLHPSKLEDECVGQSWYLANDMQFFILGVVVLVLFVAVPFLRQHLSARVAVLALVAAASAIARMVVTYDDQLWASGQIWGPEAYPGAPHNTDVKPDDAAHSKDMNGVMYIRPWYRVSTYLVGVIAGVLLDEWDQRRAAAAKQQQGGVAKMAAPAAAPPALTMGLLEEGDMTKPVPVPMAAAAAADDMDHDHLVRATSSGVGTMEYVPLDAEEEARMRAAARARSAARALAVAAEADAEAEEDDRSSQLPRRSRCTLGEDKEGVWYAGAVVALGVMVAVLWGVYGSYHGHPTSMTFNVVYHGLNRTVWSCAIAFFILACALGRLRFINRLLSLPIFLPLSKLSYSCYLIHITVLEVSLGVDRVLLHYTPYTLINLYLGVLLLTYLGAAVLFVLVEVPCARLEALVLPKL